MWRHLAPSGVRALTSFFSEWPMVNADNEFMLYRLIEIDFAPKNTKPVEK